MSTEVDYKDTLNLPTTDFPMKANLAQREPEILAKWAQLDIYKSMLQARDKQKSFILNDGPPYANGDIHIGHALNKILKDIVVKSRYLSGYYAPYIPGWDCHGLPIELQVEKKIGKAGVKVDASTFRQKCREYANQQIDIQRKSFKRLGVFGDWDNPYVTMDPAFEANIMRTLAKIIENGHLARGDRPVHWCVDCGSALAEAEVEYADKTSDAIYVKFPLIAPEKLTNKAKQVVVLIWTTTPWTLPANQAVAINGKLNYVLAEKNGEYFILADQLADKVLGEAIIIESYSGKQLEHTLLQHPFYARQVPIILGEHVTTDTGTGCVHTAPAHGNEDYIVGRHYNLPMDNPVDANGCFISTTEFFAGLHVTKANPEVIRILSEKGNLFAHDKLTHSYPHCWRHKTPLIFRATQQWFISMEKNGLRKAALEEIKKVEWIPSWGQARITGMIESRPDWCISRQRTWGTPIALIVHKETGELHPRAVEIIYKVADLVEKDGIQAWFDLELSSLLPANEANQYSKVNDTLDVWFDSGAVHSCVADTRGEMHSPVDMYLEGSDQHRGWFQTSLLSSVAMKGKAPFKQVLTHGYTVDAAGHKMSKSLGNVVAPEKVVQTLGADVLRLWVAATDYSAEVRVSDEILKRPSDAYRRIRNTARFLLANLHDFDPAKDLVNTDNMLVLDRWIIGQTAKLQQEVITAYENYDFHIVYQKVHNFCSYELGSFYLDVIKDRQYTCKKDGVPRRSAQTALYYIIEALVRWIAPILSFTAEEIWSFMPGKHNESVFLNAWYNQLPGLSEDNNMDDSFWHAVLQVRDEVNKVLEAARKEKGLGSGLEAELVLYCDEHLYSKLLKLQDELRFVLITSGAKIRPITEVSEQAITTDLSGLVIELKVSQHAKCNRCWHRTADVNSDPKYPGICKRCVENLSEQGEARVYA